MVDARDGRGVVSLEEVEAESEFALQLDAEIAKDEEPLFPRVGLAAVVDGRRSRTDQGICERLGVLCHLFSVFRYQVADDKVEGTCWGPG